MKVLVVVDKLHQYGGGSSVVLKILKETHWDVASAWVNKKFLDEIQFRGKSYEIMPTIFTRNSSLAYFFFIPLTFLLSQRLRTIKKHYDKILYIGNFSFLSAEKNENNIWFCFSPNRILYDLQSWKLTNSGSIRKAAFLLHDFLLRNADQNIARHNIRKILTQSKVSARRISTYYSRSSTVVFSPIDTSVYKTGRTGDYFLAVSRLMPEKRMDFIARSFVACKKKLILVGDGPEKTKIQRIIEHAENIELRTCVTNSELIELYANSKAVVYMPKDEDFGLVPLEAMASGKICIASDEGGCKETILHGKTGYLISPTQADLIQAVSVISPELALVMKPACISRAKQYDIHQFMKTLHQEIFS